MTTGDSGPAGRAAPAGMPACHRDRRGREELRASGQEREHVPVPGGDNAGTGWTPDNGLVSRGVDAVAVCPISGGYRTFASSQAPGKVDRFLLPRGICRDRQPGQRRLRSQVACCRTPSERPHDRTDFKFQAWCEARPPGVPAERRATGGLFPAGPLVMHRLEAPSRPGSAFHFAIPVIPS